MKKFTVWIKKHKKLAVFLCIAIIIAAAVLTIRHKAQAAMAQLAELTEETAVVEKRSIQSSVSSTGTIISDKTRSITATLTGMEVLRVDVEVGDVVQEGDTICTFDPDQRYGKQREKGAGAGRRDAELPDRICRKERDLCRRGL